MTIQPWMSTEQRTYIETAREHESVWARFQADLPPCPERGNGNGAYQRALDAYAEAHGALAAKYNLVEVVMAKLDARWALLDWARGILAQDPANQADLPEILAAFKRAEQNSTLMEELVAMCLELNPAKAKEVIA